MSATERYLRALEGDEPTAELDALLGQVESEDGPMAAIRCLEQRVQRAGDDGEPELRSAVVELCDRIAREAGGEVALEAALRAVSWRGDDAEDGEDAVLRALLLTVHNPADLKRAADATGGVDAARSILATTLKTPEVKADGERSAELRRLLGKLFDIEGDADRAFFELLKAVRKAPNEAMYLDEAFQLALAAERFEEATVVFEELADDERLEPKLRATLCNKMAHLLERGLENPTAALMAYERSLTLHPGSKGAKRHRDRLRKMLGDAAPPVGEDAIDIDADDVLDEMTAPPTEAPGAAHATPPGPPPPEEFSLDDAFVPGSPDVTAPAANLESLMATAEAPRPSTESDMETAEAPDVTGSAPPLSEVFGAGPAPFSEDALPPASAEISPFDEPGLGPPVGVGELDADTDLVVADDELSMDGEPETTAKDSAADPDVTAPEPPPEGDEGDGPTRLAPFLANQQTAEAAESLPAATVEGSPVDVFERAGTLLGGDDVEGCIECAEAMLGREDRGSMALRVAGHGLMLAAKMGLPLPQRAVAVFEHEAAANPEVAIAKAAEVLEVLEEPAGYAWLFTAAAEVCDDPKRVRELLEPVVRATGVDSEPMKLLDKKLGVDLEAKLDVRRAAADADRPKARVWLESSVDLLEGAKLQDRARALLAELALEVAPDNEKIRGRAREAHAADPEAERAFLVALVDKLPPARVRGVREELARGLLKDGELDKAEEHGRALANDPHARAAGYSILDGVLDARGDSEAAHALAEERLKVAYDDGQPGDAELVALVERHLAKDERDALPDLVKAHASRDVGDLSAVGSISARLDELEQPLEAARLLLAAAEAGGTKDARRGWLEAALERSLEHDRALANDVSEALLDVEPDHLAATVARAELAVELGDAQGALKPLERLVARTDDAQEKARLHAQIGAILEEHLEDPAGAAKRYRAATDADPGHADAWRAQARIAEAAGDHAARAAALEGLLRELPERDPDAGALHRAHADALSRSGKTVEAERALKSALDVDAGDTDALKTWLSSLVTRLDDAALDLAFEPSDALLTVLGDQLSPAWKLDDAPAACRRLAVLARARQPDPGDLEDLFRGLLDARPDDRSLLRAYAAWLAGQKDDLALEHRADALERLLRLEDDEAALARFGGDLAVVRRALGDTAGALATLHDAIAASLKNGNQDAMSDAALDAALQLLASGDVSDPRLRVDALELKGRRLPGEKGAMFLEEAARVAKERAEDPDRARALLNLAVERAPERAESREALLELELETGRGEEAISTSEGLLKGERDPGRRAELHVRLADMIRRVRDDDAAALEHLHGALKESPKHPAALAAAEAWYQEHEDPRGLAKLYTTQLSRLDRDDREGRVVVLDRLAKVRRYDLRDQDGALEALEAIAALDPNAIKPREDAARILTDLGRDQDAAAAWRAVLERDPLSADAWRALFSLLTAGGRGDEAFAVAQAIVSVELGDRDLERAVRQLRPPFPRWPRAPDDSSRFKRELAHPLERTPIRTVLEVVGRPVHASFAKSLKEFGFRKKDRLSERNVPPSLLLAVRTVAQLIGLGGVPPLFRGERAGEHTPSFALLPAKEPGIVIAEDALRGGMTPERAFALGRAMACLSSHALPVSTLGPQRLKEVLEALTARFVPAAEGKGVHSRVNELGQQLDMAIFRGQPPKTAERVRAALETALRDYVHAREHLHVADWIAGVGYTGDRLGFLLVGDLAPCVRVIKQGAPKDKAIGARLATRELVLFSASTGYLSLRHELGLALPPNIAAPILELG
jgi:predicted Zn-dependent protease